MSLFPTLRPGLLGALTTALVISSCGLSFAESLRIVPTYENASVYVEAVAQGSPSPKLKYREKGAADWLDAHDLTTSAKDPTPRGSLFGLRENTTYEVRCEDPKGTFLASAEFTTWADQVPIARTVHLRDLSPDGGPVLIDQSGSPDGWIRYVSDPGFVVNGGTTDEEAILLENVRYVILEGVTIKGGRRHGIQIRNSEQVRIRNCDISGFGRVGIQDIKRGGMYFMPGETKPINWDAGIYVDLSGNLTVENNYIHDPRNRANSWFYGHPAGPTAMLIRSKGGMVIRYNDFVGSDEHRWNDVIEGYGNEQVDGGFNRDSDIYGNYLAYANDDGIELDGGQCNVRLYGNKIEGGLCGISTAPNFRGPSYVFNNLVVNLGDERGVASAAVKNGGGTTNSIGKTYFYHNTFFTFGHGLAAIGFGSDKNRGMFLGDSLNNVFATGGLGINDNVRPPGNRYDHDVFTSPTGGSGDYDVDGAVEASGIKTEVRFSAPKQGGLTFSAQSEGRGGGVRLPGFAFIQPAGNAVDAGISAAAPLPLRRTRAVSNQGQFFLMSYAGKPAPNQQWVIKPQGLSAPAHFTVLKNETTGWLKVTPTEGTLQPDKETTLTISLDPTDVQGRGLLLGALIFKLDNGESLPAAVYGVATAASLRNLLEAEQLAGHEGFEIVTDATASGGSAVRLVDEQAGLSGKGTKAISFTINAPAAGAYYVSFRVRSAKPYERHDSLFMSVNDSAPQLCSIIPGSHWQWCRLTGKTMHLDLHAGENHIRLIPREEIELDAVLTSDRPFFPGDDLKSFVGEVHVP